MKLLFIHNDYGRYSGEEAACEGLAQLLTEHGHDVDWYRRSSTEIGTSFASHVRAFASGIHNPRARREVDAILDTKRPDIVYVQNLYPFISPSVLSSCRARGIPVVMRCPNYRLFCPDGLHLTAGAVCERCLGSGREIWCVLRNCEGSIPKSAGYALRNATARLSQSILNGVDVFIVLSEFQKRRFMDQGIAEDRLAILPNIAAQACDNGIPGSGSTVSFLGRIAVEKAFDEFVAAARALPDIPFFAAGDVKAGQEYLVQGLPPNLTWRGFLKGEELDAFVRDTRVFVNPSRWFEGFPNTVAKMMSQGKPVVAARIGALAEIVDDGITGLLYAPGDVTVLIEKIRGLWSSPERCAELGAQGRIKALRDYSADAVYDRLMRVCDRLRNTQ